jgi:1-acyl-sn-glycerol-3-phosphate acyltransferase
MTHGHRIHERTPAWRWRPEPVFAALAPIAVRLTRAWLRIRVTGALPRSGPVLLLANHPSHVDPLVILAAVHPRRPRFLALADLFARPGLGWLLRAARMIPVVRGGGVDRMVSDACAAIAAGQLVVIYPEGRLARPGEVLPAKPGAGLLALQAVAAGATVVPAALAGLHPGRPGGKLPRPRARVAVRFGAPVDLSPWAGRRDREAQLEAAAQCLAEVRGLAPPEQRAARRGAA